MTSAGAPGAPEDLLEGVDLDDLPEDDDVHVDVSSGLPRSPAKAARELRELEPLLAGLRTLGITDSKLDHLKRVLGRVTRDGRGVLVFTQYADTMHYLRAEFVRDYGEAVASYSGEGGSVYRGGRWAQISKDEVTRLLRAGAVKFLVCTDAASEGLNLQAAGAVINYDLPWNPSRVEQRIGRVDRIGQRLPSVKIVNLYLRNSVDDQVYRALRERCGLFEHFVGEMQPVLALARRMLDGREPVDVAALEREAAELKEDQARRAAYRTSAVQAVTPADPSVTLKDFVEVIRSLPPEAGVGDGGDGVLEVQGVRYSADPPVLERDATIRPISALDPQLRSLAFSLEQPGERLPLVVQTVERGWFRRSVLLWVEGATTAPIIDMRDLKARLERWAGAPPDPQAWIHAEKLARELAEADVAEMEARAGRLAAAALARQTRAAQFRMRWQLGKYLACRDPNVRDPNGEMYRVMSDTRELSSRRLKRVYQLVGYPQWGEPMLSELRRFGRNLSTHEKKSRLSGKQLDAALEDPRWQAVASARAS